MTKQLLITGASGFLGSRIALFACQAGWQVSAFDRRPFPGDCAVKSFVGDLSDTEMLHEACAGMSAVVHAAGLAHVRGSRAKDCAWFHQINELGTKNVVAAATDCGVPHLVLVSSVSVYGNYDGDWCDEAMPCRPRGAYAESKWGAEQYAQEFVERACNSLTILRFATLYGEGDPGNVARLIRLIERGRFIWPGPGDTRKSLIHRDDAARACLRAAEQGLAGTAIFNVAAPAVTIREIVAAICQVLGRPVPRYRIPLWMLRCAGSIARHVGDPGHLAANLHKFTHNDSYDGGRFQAIFSFVPEVSLVEGMRREVADLRKGAEESSIRDRAAQLDLD